MRNVLVTGGSRGLGLGIAKALAATDFRVIAVARANRPISLPRRKTRSSSAASARCISGRSISARPNRWQDSSKS
jgi:NAD(P)-dependent dehydrogenase (short-subunit alcohol dehydrogenase family)